MKGGIACEISASSSVHTGLRISVPSDQRGEGPPRSQKMERQIFLEWVLLLASAMRHQELGTGPKAYSLHLQSARTAALWGETGVTKWKLPAEHTSVTRTSEEDDIFNVKTGIISEFEHHILEHGPFFQLEMPPVLSWRVLATFLWFGDAWNLTGRCGGNWFVAWAERTVCTEQ